MRTRKTSGIIILKRDFGESDRIFHILTEQEGKIEVIAKNVRNGSRRSGHLELFNYGKFFLYQSKNHSYLNQCETINEFPMLKNNLQSIGTAYFAAEILDKLLPLEDPHPELFTTTLNLLKTIESSLKNDLALLTFKIKLMYEMGLLPDLLECHSCGNKLAPTLTYLANEHHYYCNNCSDAPGTTVSPNTIKLYYYLKKSSFTDAMKLKTDKSLDLALHELNTLTDIYLQDHLGKPLTTTQI